MTRQSESERKSAQAKKQARAKALKKAKDSAAAEDVERVRGEHRRLREDFLARNERRRYGLQEPI